MLYEMLNRNLRRVTSAGITLLALTILLIVMTGSAGATALPVTGPPFPPCATPGSGCLNGGNFSIQVLANSCVNYFTGATPDACSAATPDSYSVQGFSDATIFTAGSSASDFQKDLSFFVAPPDVDYVNAQSPLPGSQVFFDLLGVIGSQQPPCPASPSGIISCSDGIFTLTQQDLNTGGIVCPGGTGQCGQVTVSYAFSAIGYTGSSATGSTPYQFNYSSQFNNETVADLINKAFTTNGISNAGSFSANPVFIPEPVGFVLVGSGLVGISFLMRRRRSRRA